MNTAYIALGSNLGERETYLRTALKHLIKISSQHSISFSSVYETSPMGENAKFSFLNMVAKISYNNTPHQLLNELKRIEVSIGRKNRERWHEREIDLDLLLMDELVIHEKDFILPHPGITERDFVLIPLLEISPSLLHPKSGIPLAELEKKLQTRYILRKFTL